MFMLLLVSFFLYVIGNFWTTLIIQKYLYRVNTVNQDNFLIQNSTRECAKNSIGYTI